MLAIVECMTMPDKGVYEKISRGGCSDRCKANHRGSARRSAVGTVHGGLRLELDLACNHDG